MYPAGIVALSACGIGTGIFAAVIGYIPVCYVRHGKDERSAAVLVAVGAIGA